MAANDYDITFLSNAMAVSPSHRCFLVLSPLHVPPLQQVAIGYPIVWSISCPATIDLLVLCLGACEIHCLAQAWYLPVW